MIINTNILLLYMEVFMKNSPHRNKHMQKKALREARRISLNATEQLSASPIKREGLTSLRSDRCKEILNLYKKHLERLRYLKGPHTKRTTPGGVQQLSHDGMNLRNPDKFKAHWKASDLERSQRIARKMLKTPHYRKAA